MAQILPFQPSGDASHISGRKVRTRDYRSERERGRLGLIEQALAIREQAGNDRLSNDRWMYLVRVLLDCPLPYRPTVARTVIRRTRLASGWVAVIYTARDPRAQMPFGTDARLLHWLIDREIRRTSRTIHGIALRDHALRIDCVRDFLVDCGLSCSGENYKAVQAGFQRLKGLGITLDFEGRHRGSLEEPLTLLGSHDLAGSGPDPCDQDGLATDLRGFELSQLFYENGADYCARVPRQIWRLLKGKPQKGAMLLWLYVRQYAAESTSSVPWDILHKQLSCEDSNPGRLRSRMQEAVCALRAMWPMIDIRVEADGIVIGKAAANIVRDDPHRNRIFRRPRSSPAVE